ncbi:MAG: histidine kinase [Trueperaceae bacterium]|nr:histidine kinase [Trueperaceae bacterium]
MDAHAAAGTPPRTDVEPVASSGRTLSRQIQRTRLWFPVTIAAVVGVFEILLFPQLGPVVLWVRLAFYGLLGPALTFLTLSWIVGEVEAREAAQRRFWTTYHELQDSHELLSSIQRVTERFAAATDLETAVRAAASGIREVTGSEAAAVLLGSGPRELVAHDGLREGMEVLLQERDAALRRGESQADACDTPYGPRVVISMPIRTGGEVEGSLHAMFTEVPGARAREAFGILAGQFASVAEAARSRMRDLLTLFDVDRSIRAEGNLHRLLEALLERTMQRLGATRGAVLLDDGAGELQPQVVRGAASAQPLRLAGGQLGPLGGGSEPVLLSRLDEAARREAGPLLDEAGCAVILPLSADGEPLGMVLLAHEDPGALEEAQLSFLSLIAGQVSLALRNARAYLHSEEVAIGEERSRIAREIHDGVAQSLAFAALKIDLGRRLQGRDAERAAQEFAEAGDTVREAIRELRRSIFALRPVDLERHGFKETVRRYLGDFGPQNDVRVETAFGELPDLEVRNEAVLFRIFQEAMHNVAKHADASTVTVRLGTDPEGRAFVEVEDDGAGFDPEAVSDRVTSAGGLGLRQMRERVEARRGRFTLKSAPGHGTRVRAALR